MSQRYFKVLHAAGVFIDNYHYAQDAIIEYTPKEGENCYWGQEVDKNGDPVGDLKTGHELSDKMADNFGKTGTGQKTDADDKPQDENPKDTGKKEDPKPDPKKDEKDEDKGGDNGPEVPEERAAQIKEALGLLDPSNAEHWTVKGQANVEVVEGLLGYKTSRAELEAVQPGFERPKK